MSTITWGIIGCGDVTEVKSGPAFNKVASSKLVAVMRRNKAKAEDYAMRHHVPKWYGDAQQLIDDPEVNAIYIATPPSSHEEYAIKALRAGKPVYLEKPMTIDAASASRICDIAKQTGIKISIAHYRRQLPLFLQIRSLLKEKAIGHIQSVDLRFSQPYHTDIIARTEVPWRLDPSISGGGLFHDLAPHQLDLMVYFFGKAINASGIASNEGGLYTADDRVKGQILFENEILFRGQWNFTASEKTDLCEISGTEGKISFSIFENQPLRILKEGTETTMEFERPEHVQLPMIRKVVEYFLNQAENPCTAEEGLESMQLIDAFTRSMPLNRTNE